MGLYIVGFVSYGATMVFYAAAFPRLARNTSRSRDLRERYENGQISIEEYEKEGSPIIHWFCMFFFPCKKIITGRTIATTRIGFCLGFGGVRVRYRDNHR